MGGRNRPKTHDSRNTHHNKSSQGQSRDNTNNKVNRNRRTDDRKPKDTKKRKRPTAENENHSTSLEKINVVTWDEETPLRYVAQVGQGTYGKVYKAMDRVTSRLYAMKRLRLETQHEGFPVTAAREIKLLQVLRHPNIVNLSEIVVSKNEIYMALDYIEHDLAGLLLNSDLLIAPKNSKSLIRQTLAALSFLHDHQILHRDIKGSNILVTANGTAKLADFGLARYINPAETSVRYTNRVITLWYRPPELLLGAEHYGPEIDVWGIGCLLVELFKKTPLFQGKDEVSQIQAIQSVMGIPSAAEWPEYYKLPWYHFISSLPPDGSVSYNRFNKIFSGQDITPACFNLAEKLLAMNPSQRITASDALNHQYFKEDPKEQRLDLSMEMEWHDWEAKKRKRNDTAQ